MELVCRLAELEERIARDVGRVVRAVSSTVVKADSSNKQIFTNQVKEAPSQEIRPSSRNGEGTVRVSPPSELPLSDTSQDVHCWARANLDFMPSPYDDSSLSFKSGQIIKVLDRCKTGLWLGECNGRRGKFKFVNVTVLERYEPSRIVPAEHLTTPLPEFLSQIGLSSLSPRLLLHGYDTVLSLLELDQHTLRLLGITDTAETEKLLFTNKIIASIFTGYTQDYGKEESLKPYKEKEPVVLDYKVLDYKTQFENTLKKFDDKPRHRLIPTCGYRQRIL